MVPKTGHRNKLEQSLHLQLQKTQNQTKPKPYFLSHKTIMDWGPYFIESHFCLSIQHKEKILFPLQWVYTVQ